ncbi:MAG: hypothetical protein Q8Q09_22640 [Deltaproteobacteria bacterium]|nr:hypothetical protein [Deltaproteobacteria bacterium]
MTARARWLCALVFASVGCGVSVQPVPSTDAAHDRAARDALWPGSDGTGAVDAGEGHDALASRDADASRARDGSWPDVYNRISPCRSIEDCPSRRLPEDPYADYVFDCCDGWCYAGSCPEDPPRPDAPPIPFCDRQAEEPACDTSAGFYCCITPAALLVHPGPFCARPGTGECLQ